MSNIEKDIKAIDRKLYNTEDDEITINLLFTKVEILEEDRERLIKENEELRTSISFKEKVIADMMPNEVIKKDYISKDKISEIIDKLECMDYYGVQDAIEDLDKILGDD